MMMEWRCRGEEGLKTLIANYFFGLFTPMAGANLSQVLDTVTPRVSPQMNDVLCGEFSAAEIKKALDEMGDLKAPGADGMPAIFYNKFWSAVSDSVVQEVLNVLRGGSMPEGWKYKRSSPY